MADPPRFRAIQIDSPNQFANMTQVFGINNKGEATGSGGVGFVWLPDAAYGLSPGAHELTVTSAGSVPFAINDNGRIAGWSQSQGAVVHLYMWNLNGIDPFAGEMVEQDPGIPHRVAINNSDVMVATRWESCSSGACEKGFLLQWMANGQHQDDTLEPLGDPGFAWGLAIGDSGLAGGRTAAFGGCEPGTAGCETCPWWCADGDAGATWTQPASPSTLIPYGMYPDFCKDDPAGMWAHGINIDDRIVGAGWDTDFPATDPLGGVCIAVHSATIWTSRIASPLRLPWPSGMFGERTEAHSISDSLEDDTVLVAGYNTEQDLALLWRVPADKIGDGNPADWEAYDLNEPGIVDLRETQFEFLREATGVNNMGWISGWGQWFDGVMRTRAFVLVPLDICAGDITGPLGVPDGKVDIADLLQLLADWGDCPTNPSAPCWADLNGHGVVNIADLDILLANWGNCPGYGGVRSIFSLEEELEDQGLTWQQWLDFRNVLETGTSAEQENWICWFITYMTKDCTNCEECPGADPFFSE